MNDDKTIISLSASSQKKGETDHTVILQPGVKVSLLDHNENILKEFIFTNSFTVGRSPDNDIVLTSKIVSRHHFEIRKDQDWWIYDLNSANGIFINNERIIQKLQLNLPARITLGKFGIPIQIEAVKQTLSASSRNVDNSETINLETTTKTNSFGREYSKEELKARLLSKSDGKDFGTYTRMVRRIIHEDRIGRGQSYKKIIWLVSVLFLFSLALIAYQQSALSDARNLAIDMFYDIKELEVDLSQAEIRLTESSEVLDLTLKVIVEKQLKNEQQRIAAEQKKIEIEKRLVAQKRQKLREMKARYQQYVDEAKSLSFSILNKSQYENDLIIKVARGFGESELELSDDFIAEVKWYITKWQQSSRMHQAMAHLEVHGYSSVIKNALNKEGLPLYFAYLPLQESNYDTNAIGPETRFGIAKGAWQFLPTTGQEFGLLPGPLADKAEYDEHDERFDFDKATHAGAKYLKYLFSTEAQASGLLVLASYNYGHTRLKEVLSQIPDNPREKNFWKLVQQYDLPEETYDYVLSIFSAAVIGEDPLYFGFGFKQLFIK